MEQERAATIRHPISPIHGVPRRRLDLLAGLAWHEGTTPAARNGGSSDRSTDPELPLRKIKKEEDA